MADANSSTVRAGFSKGLKLSRLTSANSAAASIPARVSASSQPLRAAEGEIPADEGEARGRMAGRKAVARAAIGRQAPVRHVVCESTEIGEFPRAAGVAAGLEQGHRQGAEQGRGGELQPLTEADA